MSKRELLFPRSRADQEAGLQILRSIACVGGGDAHHAADGDGERAEGGSGPSLHEENRGSGHQCCDGHAGDGIGRAADQADDARGNSDEKKSKHDDKERRSQIGKQAGLRAGDGFEGEE